MTAPRRLSGAAGGSTHGLHKFVRLLAKVERVDGEGCWLFVGKRSLSGYGQIAVNQPGEPKRNEQAHRVAYEMAFGPIPPGQVVRHRCDTPACCRPAHLELGTQADNVRDMVERGRHRHGVFIGEAHPNARLTDEQVVAIRAERAAGALLRVIAARYGVSKSTVSGIARGHRRIAS